MDEKRGRNESGQTDDGSGRGNSEEGEYEYLYEKYDLNKKYRHQRGFSADESYHGDGKYPPDWGERRTDIDDPVGGRREAIAEHQDHTCARCRRDLRDFEYFNAHHYRPIGDDGTHELGNLLALCGPCHKLIHPDNDLLEDDWRDAPMFPAPNADSRIATVRKPVSRSEREEYVPELELLELSSSEGENTFTTSEATYSLSPADAVDARDDLSELLANRGLSLDREVTVHVVNPIHSPLRDATVTANLSLGDHGTYTFRAETDDRGEVTFSVPSTTRSISVGVTKKDFERASAEIPAGDDAITETVKMTPAEASAASLGGTGESDSGPEATAPRSASDAGSDAESGSRRGLLKLVGGASLAGLGYAVGTGGKVGSLLGSGPSDSAGSGGSSGGSDDPPLAAGWSFDTDTAATVQSIETAGDRAVFNTEVGTVTALEPSGEKAWSADLRETMTQPLSVVEGGVVAASRNAVQAYDAETGDRRWEFSEIPSGTEPAVAAGDGVVCVLLPYEEDDDEQQNLVVLDAETGEERWRARSNWSSAPSVYDGDVLVPDHGALVAFDAAADPPSTREEVSLEVNRASSLAIGDGRAYATGIVKDYDILESYTYVSAVDIASRTLLWSEQVHNHRGDEPTPTGPTALDGTVVWTGDVAIDALDDSGAARWETETTGRVTSSPVLFDGTPYLGIFEDDSNYLWGFDLGSGDGVSAVRLDAAAVAGVADGDALYVGTEDGRVEQFTPN